MKDEHGCQELEVVVNVIVNRLSASAPVLEVRRENAQSVKYLKCYKYNKLILFFCTLYIYCYIVFPLISSPPAHSPALIQFNLRGLRSGVSLPVELEAPIPQVTLDQSNRQFVQIKLPDSTFTGRVDSSPGHRRLCLVSEAESQ